MNRREFIKTAGIGTACLLAGQFSMFAEGSARRMEIKAVKLYENGFMTQSHGKRLGHKTILIKFDGFDFHASCAPLCKH